MTTVPLRRFYAYFLRLGATGFGGPIALAGFMTDGLALAQLVPGPLAAQLLYGELVQIHGWLNDRQFLDSVAVAMITPGPVVITVAFIGYLVGGPWGMSVAAVAVFLPVYLFVVLPAPYFRKHRNQPIVKGFVEGVSAAATGAIAGASYVIATRAIIDWPTSLIALLSFVVLARWRISELWVIAGAAAIGLVATGSGSLS